MGGRSRRTPLRPNDVILIDCLIAAIAIRVSVSILQTDADFDVLSRHTALTAA